MFETQEIAIPCPGCGTKNPKTLGSLKESGVFKCAGCPATITVEREEFLRGLADAEKSIDDFKRSLRGFGR